MPKIYLFSTSSHPEAISVNSLNITLLKPNINFSQYDYFIMTSKQVSKALQEYNPKYFKPALCISKLTAKAYENIGGTLLEVGMGYGDDLALKIKQYPKSTNWLYLRAEVVASDFVFECQKEGYNIDESIVYKSACSTEIENISVESDSVLIFTSPSSVKCFLKTHEISSLNKTIVIGKTTALALPQHIKYTLSKETTIESCINSI